MNHDDDEPQSSDGVAARYRSILAGRESTDGGVEGAEIVVDLAAVRHNCLVLRDVVAPAQPNNPPDLVAEVDAPEPPEAPEPPLPASAIDNPACGAVPGVVGFMVSRTFAARPGMRIDVDQGAATPVRAK